jgi:hypothetical protein
MKCTYRYEVFGTAADGQTWVAEGEIESANPGEFARVPIQALHRSFDQLTDGKAVYGKPGLACRGPYRMRRFLIEDITTTEEVPVVMPRSVGRGQ